MTEIKMEKMNADTVALESGICLVTLPIGNALDITQNALAKLKVANLIYCEDTRVFKDLAQRLSLDLSNKEVYSFHDHSNEKQAMHIINQAKEKSVVFVSDAGSPCLCDPAFDLVKMAIKEDVNISNCSGITSVMAALELSGLPLIPFHFHGFLARENSKQNALIEQMKSQYGTHVLFEGVSRVDKTLKMLCDHFPQSSFVVAKELTKTHETIYRFKGDEYEKTQIDFRGEFVLMFYQESKAQLSSSGLVKLAEQILEKGNKPKLVAKLLAQILNESSKDIYNKLGER